MNAVMLDTDILAGIAIVNDLQLVTTIPLILKG